MPPRARALVLALTAAVAPVLGGCSADEGPRKTGDPVTQEEARILADLLHRNFQKGGADFVVTAPYGETAVLTLTGELDFRESVGHAEAVTTFGDGRDDDVRTLYFTTDEIWVGEMPGLGEALADDGADDAAYLRRPLADGTDDHGPPLADVLVEVLLRLAAESADDPQAFRADGYTWQGQRSIDSRLASLFGLREGRTVAVGAADDLLLQYETPLADGAVEVTVTLSDHGRRRVAMPADEETALVADHPEVAAALGV
jgi:hypothetical protein